MKQKTKNRDLLKIGAVLCLLALWVAIPFSFNDKVKASGGDNSPVILTRTAVLSAPGGGNNPHGSATFELSQNNQRELEVEAEDVNLADGTVLSFFIDGAQVGTSPLAARKAKLKLRSESGDNIPAINEGSAVEVRNGSAVLLAGAFGAGTTTTPTPTATQTGTPTITPTVTPTVTPNGSDLFAGLSGATINGVVPTGYAQFEVHSSRLELEIRIRQVNLASGTSLAAVVDNVSVGSLVVQNGEGRLRLRTDRGDNVPAVVNGSTIKLNNGNATVLNGSFAGLANPGGTPTPTPGGPTPTPFGRAFEANLTGAQVDPPVTTNATGEFKVRLNADETQATIFGEFHGLSSAQTGARIESTVGTATLIHDFGVRGGLNGEFAPVTIDVNAAQVQQFRAGVVRAVITSTNNPNGEIAALFRAQNDHADFDGDGSNDFAVFRPSNGAWYTQNSSGFTVQTFGSASDKIVSSDFDGDGKTDVAMFTNENGLGVWSILRSSDGGVTKTQFGLATDEPMRGDFDGDGRVDTAVFRPSTGVWYIQYSSNGGFNFVQFGLNGDKAIPADMDGDGKDDILVFRPDSGNWYWINSSNNQIGAVHWGSPGDVPVKADFDGDGRQDLTVYRPSTGVWYSTLSSNGGFYGMQFGLGGDIPVAGNYDNDGKTDIAVYRPSDGNWYIYRSADNQFQVMHFGASEDVPAIAN